MDLDGSGALVQTSVRPVSDESKSSAQSMSQSLFSPMLHSPCHRVACWIATASLRGGTSVLTEIELDHLFDRREFAPFPPQVRKRGEFTVEEVVQLKKQFDIVDLDGSGGIDVNELWLMLRRQGFRPTVDEATKMLEEYDEDGSGTIEFEEYLKILKR